MSTSEKFGEEVPHLPEAFQAARRGYGLASALLIAWELIGIEFDESPINGLRVTLETPQAVPYVLTALTLYFAFRFTVEWHQADERRRDIVASRVDFVVAHLIGAAALVLYIYQSLLRVQIADLIDPSRFPIFMAGFALTLGLAGVYRGIVTRRVTLRFSPSDLRFFIFVFFHLLLLASIWRAVRDGDARELFSGMILGLFTYVLVLISSRGASPKEEKLKSIGSQEPNPAAPADQKASLPGR